jgi:hypothetical protein
MPKSTPAPSRLLAFLGGEGIDGAGRTLDEVLAFDDPALERHHDFIQWLFPLPEWSGANPNAPILTGEDIAAVRSDPSLQRAVERSLQRMSAFYARNAHWLRGHDHNHLRITRIIRSVGHLLGPEPAERFYNLVSDREAGAGHPVATGNKRFWREALAEARRQTPQT